MSEYVELTKQFSNHAFNDEPHKRNKQHALIQFEAANIMASNYDLDTARMYSKVYGWNRRVLNWMSQLGVNTGEINGFPLCDNYYNLNEFMPVEKKEGVCVICRYRPQQSCPFDISHKRVEVFNNLSNITKHAYGKIPYCKEHYKGVIGLDKGTYPSSIDKLRLLNRYKFNICFENAYHEFWSWDYITEKIFDCFKAKTVAIYYGCYNIQKLIPKELYIDYRDFDNDNQLSEYLLSMDNNTYHKMTEDAYKWEKKCKLGNIGDFKRDIMK